MPEFAPPPGAKAVPTPCPRCTEPALYIHEKLKASPLGSFSLSGGQMKFSARGAFYLTCGNCGAETEGTVTPEGTHAEFDPRLMVNDV